MVTGLGDDRDLAIFVRDAGKVVAGISGWTWGDSCELQNLWVDPSLRGQGLATRLIAAAEAEAAARGCSQTVHFTYDFQARALYERNGYELVSRVEEFPSGTDVLWYRKRLQPSRPMRGDLADLKLIRTRVERVRRSCRQAPDRAIRRAGDRASRSGSVARGSQDQQLRSIGPSDPETLTPFDDERRALPGPGRGSSAVAGSRCR